MPLSSIIMITDKCNLNCSHCYHKHKNNRCDINKVIDFLEKDKPIIVSLFGGEPFLEENLDIVEKILDYCKDKNIVCSMISNLTFELTEKHIEIAKRLFGLNTSFNIKRWHNEDEYNLWKNNVNFLTKNGIKINCAMTLDKDLIYKSPEEIYNLTKDFPFNEIHFEPYVGLNKPNNKDIDNWLCKFYELSKNDNNINFLFKTIISKFQGKNISGHFNRNCWKVCSTLHVDGHITCCPISQIDITNGREVLEPLYSLKEKCLKCKWLKCCDGVCPLLIDDKDYCHGYPKLYQLIENDMINS